MPEQFSDREVGGVIQPCPKQPRPDYWLEIELVGEDLSPVPYEEYRVTPQGQDSIKGYLDQDGWARIDGLDSSAPCEVTFPALDKEAWEPREVLPARS
jgi:hypothetical protein